MSGDASSLAGSRLTSWDSGVVAQRVVILGSAGSGKTTLLVDRVAKLAEAGASQGSIALLATTPRGKRVLEAAARRRRPLAPPVMTLHELAAAIVQRDYRLLGLSHPPRILASLELWRTLRLALSADDRHTWQRPPGRPAGELRLLRALAHDLLIVGVENGLSPDQLRSRALAWGRPDLADVAGFLGRFVSSRFRGAVARPELLSLAARLLGEHPAVAAYWQRTYRHVLLDEAEDASRAQVDLLCLLVGADTDLIVAGNPDSAIAAYGGGDPAHLLGLAARLGATQETLARAAPRPNSTEDGSGVRGGSCRAVLHPHAYQADEARWVAARIDALLQSGSPVNSIAVLLRRQHEPIGGHIESELRRLGVPCARADATHVTDDPLVRATIDLLRYLAATQPAQRLSAEVDAGPAREALRRFLESPLAGLPPFGPRTLNDACLRAGRALADLEADGITGLDLPTDLAGSVAALLDRLAELRSLGGAGTARLLWHVWTAFQAFRADATEAGDGSRAFRVLLEEVSRQEIRGETSLSEFLDSLGGGDFDHLWSRRAEPSGVLLLTVHAAKGSEWDYVFVPGLVDGAYPLRHSPYEVSRFTSWSLPDEPADDSRDLASLQEATQLAEERRVFNVAMTRARRVLFLSYSLHSADGGSTELPSRYLSAVREWSSVEVETDDAVLPADVDSACAHYRRQLRAEDPARRAQGLYALSALGRLWPNRLAPRAWWDSVVESTGAQAPFPDGRLYLTASRLSSFRDCPLSYQFSYHWRLGEAEGTALTIGNLLHSVLKEYHEPGSTVPRTLDGLNACLDRIFDANQFSYKPVAAQSRKVLREALAKYFRIYGAGANTLAVEKAFTFQHGEHTIAGRFDRVDRMPDASLELIDYKSGKTAMSVKDAAGDLQLALYDLAFRETPELAALGVPSRVSYLYPRAIGSTARGDGKRGYAPTDESRARLTARVDGYAKAIVGERFPPYRQVPTIFPDLDLDEIERLMGSTPCRYCMYAWICEYGESEGRGD